MPTPKTPSKKPLTHDEVIAELSRPPKPLTDEEILDEWAKTQYNPSTDKNDFKTWKELKEAYTVNTERDSLARDGWNVYLDDMEKLVNLASTLARRSQDQLSRAEERQRIRAVLEKLKAPEAEYMMLKHRHKNKIIDEALKAIGGIQGN